jgi:hypothetical protein
MLIWNVDDSVIDLVDVLTEADYNHRVMRLDDEVAEALMCDDGFGQVVEPIEPTGQVDKAFRAAHQVCPMTWKEFEAFLATSVK